nr:MAG TPA: hypothetical protein [Caudoviricetes sp.]
MEKIDLLKKGRFSSKITYFLQVNFALNEK